jgi:hypothetical protein
MGKIEIADGIVPVKTDEESAISERDVARHVVSLCFRFQVSSLRFVVIPSDIGLHRAMVMVRITEAGTEA